MITKPYLKITLALFLFPFFTLSQQNNREFVFPDIPGYKTLKCDFHMHTVFSDGLVWPTVRVAEAANEGLDAISITDHVEYHSHSDYVSGDQNSAYDIAKPYADKKGVLLIRGAEITKSMPPGHFNFLFLHDANGFDTLSWQDAIIKADEQGAFIFWNHPGWRQENEIPIWYAEHSWVYEKGLMHGIEIVNENSYYQLAHQWGIDSAMTLIGNSDIHDPVDLFFDVSEGEHRPITLVFVKEKTETGIREALDNRQSAVYYKDMLIGDEKYLLPLFYESLESVIPEIKNIGESDVTFYRNLSSIPFELVLMDNNGDEMDHKDMMPGEITSIKNNAPGKKGKYIVKNILVAPGKCLELNDLVTR